MTNEGLHPQEEGESKFFDYFYYNYDGLLGGEAVIIIDECCSSDIQEQQHI